jgi:hypothetical protein
MKQENIEIYNSRRDELLKRQLSNSENFDRAILTVSTAMLGFSLAFVKDIVNIETAQLSIALYLSWVSFILAIFSTLSSFLVGQGEINRELKRAERYYLEGDESAYKKSTETKQVTECLNFSSAFFFFTGLLLICIFVGINLSKGA